MSVALKMLYVNFIRKKPDFVGLFDNEAIAFAAAYAANKFIR